MNIANPRQIGNPGKSPALRYELMLKEESAKSGGKGITPERIAMSFEIFDELLPQLGVFQRVMKMIREELFVAVYSSDLTVGYKKLQYIPYFAITKHHLDQHNEKVQQLEAVIDSLREELSSCKHDLSKCSTALEMLREKVADKENDLTTSKRALHLKNTENDKLKKTLGQQQRAQERMKQEAGFRLSSLQSSLQDISQQAAELKKYKDTHDDLQEAFSRRVERSNDEKCSVATQRNHLRHSIRLSKTLHYQLLEIQNKSITEYEEYMNSHIADLSDVDNVDAHREVIKYQEQFRRSISEISEEIELTQTHIAKQQQRLDQLNTLHSSGAGLQSALSDHAHPANPLVPQEQVLNKYAAMISTSTNKGKSFYPHRDAVMCHSCGEKTIICPHKSFEKELILPVPLHTTHIMVSRPYCREPPKSAAPHDELAPPTKDPAPAHNKKSAPSRTIESEFCKVWKHYQKEFPDVVRLLPRQMSLQDTVLLIEQFYGNLLIEDDIADVDNPQSLMDCLYSFMQERYTISDVMQLATCDLLSAVELYCTENKALLLFASLICGKVDVSCFRYFLTIATFATKLNLQTTDHFHQFASIVYPFLREDDVDQLSMDYVAYSLNKCSNQSVLDFIIYLLLKEKEPRVMEMESQLLEFTTNQAGSFTLLEFIEASDKLVSLSSDQLRHHLYQQSVASEGEGKTSLPVNKTAQIIAYLSVQQHCQPIIAKLEKCQFSQQHVEIVHPSTSYSTLVDVKNMASRLKSSVVKQKRKVSSTVMLQPDNYNPSGTVLQV